MDDHSIHLKGLIQRGVFIIRDVLEWNALEVRNSGRLRNKS